MYNRTGNSHNKLHRDNRLRYDKANDTQNIKKKTLKTTVMLMGTSVYCQDQQDKLVSKKINREAGIIVTGQNGNLPKCFYRFYYLLND